MHNGKKSTTLASGENLFQLYNRESGFKLDFRLFKKRISFFSTVVYRRMNGRKFVQSKSLIALDPLRSYFDERQKNEIIHLLHLHFVFTLFLFHICEVLVKIL